MSIDVNMEYESNSRTAALELAVQSMQYGTLSNNVDPNTTGAIIARAAQFEDYIDGKAPRSTN